MKVVTRRRLGLRAFALRALTLAPLITLSACWASEAPLMPASQVDAPPNILGTYQNMNSGAAHNLERNGRGLTLDRNAELLFDRLGPDIYLVQRVSELDGTSYGILRLRPDKTVREYQAECSSELLAKPHVRPDNFGGELCMFDDYATIHEEAMALVPAIMADTAENTTNLSGFHLVIDWIRD